MKKAHSPVPPPNYPPPHPPHHPPAARMYDLTCVAVLYVICSRLRLIFG